MQLFVRKVLTRVKKRNRDCDKPALDLVDPIELSRKILAMALESVSLSRPSNGFFDGERMIPSLEHFKENLIDVPLSDEPIDQWYKALTTIKLDSEYENEVESQRLTKGWWDKDTVTGEDIQRWKAVDRRRRLPVIGQARAAAGHPAAPFAHYADGNEDMPGKRCTRPPSGVDGIEILTHEQAGQTLETDQVSRRENFVKEMSIDDRCKSSRTAAGLECIQTCLADMSADSKGNILVYSHSLPVLDALLIALKKFRADRTASIFRYDGTLTAGEKDRWRKLFNSESTGNIMLLTYASGGLGLDLHSATKIIFLTPQWVPAMDRRIISRALHSGQSKKVTVYRLWAHRSVEEEVLRKHPVKEYYGDLVIGSARDKWPADWESWQTWGVREFSKQVSIGRWMRFGFSIAANSQPDAAYRTKGQRRRMKSPAGLESFWGQLLAWDMVMGIRQLSQIDQRNYSTGQAWDVWRSTG